MPENDLILILSSIIYKHVFILILKKTRIVFKIFLKRIIARYDRINRCQLLRDVDMNRLQRIRYLRDTRVPSLWIGITVDPHHYGSASLWICIIIMHCILFSKNLYLLKFSRFWKMIIWKSMREDKTRCRHKWMAFT